LERGIKKKFEEEKIVSSVYRPFSKKFFYFDKHFNGMTYQWFDIYSTEYQNKYIAYNALGNTKSFHLLGTADVIDLHLTGDSQCLPLYRYDKDGSRNDNITDWALRQFAEHYQDDSIGKEDIFHYTYAVLHNPAYRRKYETNLKREFPRVPFYRDFHKWAKWGRTLTDLHINYESAEPYPLKRIETAQKDAPKAKLRAVPEKGEIILDDNTTLSGVPAKAWDYTLGNRSALHWILDQYKEKTPKDKTIAEKFNTYIFSDYKEPVIDLLKRVCTVSVKTVDIVNKMTEEEPHE
jgi:predicted helicase